MPCQVPTITLKPSVLCSSCMPAWLQHVPRPYYKLYIRSRFIRVRVSSYQSSPSKEQIRFTCMSSVALWQRRGRDRLHQSALIVICAMRSSDWVQQSADYYQKTRILPRRVATQVIKLFDLGPWCYTAGQALPSLPVQAYQFTITSAHPKPFI